MVSCSQFGLKSTFSNNEKINSFRLFTSPLNFYYSQSTESLELSMNQIFPNISVLKDKHYIHQTSNWFTIFIRLALVLASIVFTAMIIQYRGESLLGMNGIVVSVFLYCALDSRIWGKTLKFIADENGIFFPENKSLVSNIQRIDPRKWLYVPWRNITNIRIANGIDYEGNKSKCVAFEVKVTPKEQAEFFEFVGCPTYNERNAYESLSVAYCDNSALQKSAVGILLNQMKQY